MSFFSSQKNQDDQAKLAAISRSQAVIEFSPEGTILDANENFLKVMGYQIDEIRGKHHRMFVDPVDVAKPAYQDFWANLRAGKFQSAEYKRLGKGGKEVWIQASYNPLFDKNGKVYKVIKFASDTTDAKLRNADFEGQLAAISKSQAVIEFKPDGTVIKANENFLNTLGYSLNEIVGQHHRMFCDTTYTRSSDYARFWDDLRAGKYQADVFRRLGKGNKEVWIQASYNPIYDPSGRLVKIVKFATDITEQVKKRQIGEVVDSKFTTMVGALGEVTHQTATAASAATQTAANVQTVASGAEELSSSIQEISSSVVRTKQSVEQAIKEVEAADRNTTKLSDGARSMTSIIDFIQDIASNINLLALNATIESARAGEAGKGFAVVASEVKNLASQVAQATEKISTEIAGMQTVSSDVIKALSSIRNAVTGVEESVTGVAGAVEEQTAVTNEISSNMQMTASAVKDIELSLQNIKAAAEQVALDSDELHGQVKNALS